MLKVLDRDPHSPRLRSLIQRYRAEEAQMTAALLELQAELEREHRSATIARLEEQEPGGDTLDRCIELQHECDELATELVHVRMAVTGAVEELADHEGRLLHAGSARMAGRAVAMLA